MDSYCSLKWLTFIHPMLEFQSWLDTQFLHQIQQTVSAHSIIRLSCQMIYSSAKIHTSLRKAPSVMLPCEKFFLVKFNPSCSPANDSSAKLNQQYAQMVMLPSHQQPLFTPKFIHSVMLPCQTILQPFPLIILKLLVLSSAISMHVSLLSALWHHLLAKRGEWPRKQQHYINRQSSSVMFGSVRTGTYQLVVHVVFWTCMTCSVCVAMNLFSYMFTWTMLTEMYIHRKSFYWQGFQGFQTMIRWKKKDIRKCERKV